MRTQARIEDRLARRGGALELLRIPAALYGLAVGLRGALYDVRALPSTRVEATVISVGNVTVGGTGKTPIVAWLARDLATRGRRVGVLSRGFGARAGERNDEAKLLDELLPDAKHHCDPDRVRGARALIALGVDTIVLDDAFQHRRIARDLDLVAVDATRPWGLPSDRGGEAVRALLPRGLLREPPTALARADALILTRIDQCEPRELERLRAELERLAPGRPQIGAVHRASALRAPDGTRGPASELRGREVTLASGIGNPDAFERTVRGLGATIREHRRFADHHAFDAADRASLQAVATPLVTTAKDAVKLRELGLAPTVLEIELEMLFGRSVLAALLESLPRAGEKLGRANVHEALRG